MRSEMALYKNAQAIKGIVEENSAIGSRENLLIRD